VSGPVLGAREHGIFTAFGNSYARARVRHRPAGAVRKKIAGPHLVDELRIDRPSARVGKPLAFDDYVVYRKAGKVRANRKDRNNHFSHRTFPPN